MCQFDTTDQNHLLMGDMQEIADYLGVTVQTVRNWRAGRPMPTAVLKLMQTRYGDLSGLLGEEWENFRFGQKITDATLYIPGWRKGFDPHEIRSMFFSVQLVGSLKADIQRLKRHEAALEADIAELIQKAAYYKRLVDREGKMGMMLERITEA